MSTVNYPRSQPEKERPPQTPKKPLKLTDHLLLSAYWFGSNFVWGALLGIMLASQMEAFDKVHKAANLGTLLLVGAFWALIVPLVAGPLSDRSNNRMGRRRPYLIFGGIVAVVGMLVMLAATTMHSMWVYVSGFCVLQIGSNTALASYSGVIPDMVPEAERGFASGIMALMSQVGTLIGVIGVAGFVESQVTVAYVALIVAFVLFLILTLVGLKDEQQYTVQSPPFDWSAYFKSLAEPFHSKDFAWVWITRALVMLGFYAIQPYILYYLKDVIHLAHPATEAAKVVGIILIAASVSGALGGKLSDRVGRKPIVFGSSVGLGVTSLLFILCHDLNQVLLVGIFFGLAYGAYISVDWALGTDVLPSHDEAGKDMAVWHVAMTLPQQFAPFACGMVLDSFKHSDGSIPLNGFTVLFVIAATCFVLGGVFLKNVRGAR